MPHYRVHWTEHHRAIVKAGSVQHAIELVDEYEGDTLSHVEMYDEDVEEIEPNDLDPYDMIN